MLDSRPIDGLSETEQRLMNLCLAFAHIALAVEVQGPDEARHAALSAHMKIVRSNADRPAEIPHVEIEQIDVVGLQPAQAVFQRMDHVLAAIARRVGIAGGEW